MVVSLVSFMSPATTEIYTLSLHDALPISRRFEPRDARAIAARRHTGMRDVSHAWGRRPDEARSEEHTSELQPLTNLVCRLLLEKKKKTKKGAKPTLHMDTEVDSEMTAVNQ